MRKNILAPSILAADFNILGKQLEQIDQAGAEFVHIDVMDGIFVPSISFGMPVIESIRKTTKRVFDVHLMIMDPERYIDTFARIGADSITFHLEATKNPDQVIQLIRGKGLRVGMSIKPGTPIEEAFPYLDKIDMLLIMTVEPGFGGQAFIPESFDRIKATYQYVTAQNLTLDIQVDGGISQKNLADVLDAGANVIVAGSAVFKNDIGANVREFMQIMQAKQDN